MFILLPLLLCVLFRVRVASFVCVCVFLGLFLFFCLYYCILHFVDVFLLFLDSLISVYRCDHGAEKLGQCEAIK